MDFIQIKDFPSYSISMEGNIKNEKTDRILALTLNSSGIVQVGLVRDGVQHKRSVALLVARTFLDPPHPETFDTPIHLDGDNFNNRIDNLMWRPRWFAIKYTQQFEYWRNNGAYVKERIQDIHSKEKFKDSWDAATKFGLLDKDILVAIHNRYYVWPTYQEFRILDWK